MSKLAKGTGSINIFFCLVAFSSVLIPAQTLRGDGREKKDYLRFEPYVIELRDGQKIEAEMGRLLVPEKRGKRTSKLIELAFVRLKSTAGRPGIPLIYLEGGPGGSGINAVKGPASPLLTALRETGDVILLDQRGTGASRPGLICNRTWDIPLDKPGDPREWLVLAKERLRACARDMEKQGIDLSAYNTVESADDIEALRRALGVKKVNLWGISYGTHLALTFIRRHGQSVERAILSGVNGPDDMMMKLPSTIQSQISKLGVMFKADPEIGQAVPDFSGLIKRLLSQLEKKTIAVTVPDPRTKRPVSVALSAWDLRFHTAAPVTQTFSLFNLPAFYYAMSKGDFTPLAQRAVEFRTSPVGSMMAWMMLSSSGVSAERLMRIKREAEETLLGDAINFPFPQIREALGNPDLGAGFRAPIKSNVKALLISGTLDGRTPVENAEAMRRGLPHAEHLIIEGASHGYDLFYFFPGCQEIMLDFLKGRPLQTKRITLQPFKFNPLMPDKVN